MDGRLRSPQGPNGTGAPDGPEPLMMIHLYPIRNGAMLALRNRKPQCVVRDLDPAEVTSPSTIRGRSATWVAKEATTWVRAVRRAPLGAAGEPAERPRMAGAPRPLVAGHRLGPYRLLERLGQGAQGEVWKALQVEPGIEFVALKVLKPALS